MRASGSVYDSVRLATGYAFDRPPIHPIIIRRVASDLGMVLPDGGFRLKADPADPRVERALDIGCGAGLSTAALEPIARRVVGLEPAAAMLTHRRAVCPRGLFTIGTAEHLPFDVATFNLITAAGAINYAETSSVLREVSRVLRADGVFTIYDFSDGRRFHDGDRLTRWYDAFEKRYPPQPGYAMDVRELPFADAGLRLDSYQAFQVTVTMSMDAYARYAMSQTTVEAALARGASEEDIGRWCRSTLTGVFEGRSHDVEFDAYVAYVRRRHDQGNSAGPVL
jgi:ubiquinone/menaquinone biosynthesis C-methylase UbiE